jgi:hypothetical protein|tara:strand:- start:6531 stop:6923 length:393 start_codon:yes stop_codon:yes gene_type:complete
VQKPHLSFWIVAIAGLIWNLMGSMNYIMQTNPETVAQMPDVYQMIINGRPSWATAGFAIAVFGGSVGCILLLLRKNVAVPVFMLSLAGIVLTVIHATMLVGIVPSSVLSVLVGGALLWYATIARRKNWLG